MSVVIVDDSIEFLTAAVAMLVGEGIAVCSTATGSDDALAMIDRWAPTIALIDVNLSGEDGFDLATRVVARYPKVGVVMISSRTAATYSARLSATSGIRGFLSKEDLCAESIIRFA